MLFIRVVAQIVEKSKDLQGVEIITFQHGRGNNWAMSWALENPKRPLYIVELIPDRQSQLHFHPGIVACGGRSREASRKPKPQRSNQSLQ